MNGNDMCPVCGFPEVVPMYAICRCCGFHNGIHMAGAPDSTRYRELRRLWIEQDGATWFSHPFDPPPAGWNAEAQLKDAGFDF